jgi:hypothetical protein
MEVRETTKNAMKARDIFGIAIRVAALVVVLFGFWYLAYAGALASGVPEESDGEMTGYTVCGIVFVVVGLALLRCARHIVCFSYPGNHDDSEAGNNSPNQTG